MAKKKSAKKPAGKKASKPKAAKKKAGGGGSLMPKAVSTGRGPTPYEIGKALIERFNAGKVELNDQLWSPKVVSCEGFGVSQEWRGRKAVDSKNEWWTNSHTMHGGSAEGPYVGATGFSVKFRIDVEEKATGKREMMEEVGVYTVKDGKIIREEFMYKA